jgi:hypothetical protein
VYSPVIIPTLTDRYLYFGARQRSRFCLAIYDTFGLVCSESAIHYRFRETAGCVCNAIFSNCAVCLVVFPVLTPSVIDSQFRHTNETYYVYDGKKLNERWVFL